MAGEPMVPNPRRRDLEDLQRRLSGQAPHIRSALDGSSRKMASDQVWVSSTASRWSAELEGRSRRLHRLVDDLLELVRAELAREPEKVPQSQARAYTRTKSEAP